MALIPNSTFGNYRIGEVIGEGGMGQVYLATDTTLDRKVAIKVLPDSFAQDSDRVARFEREAKTLASLNHNNIAQIFGIEKGVRVGDSDTSAPITAIVMELVEGPTLADRIAEGPLPPDEALRIARQIIDGLEAAHDKGIVHRDLKPANIKVKEDGLVKILDFGIAKSIEVTGSSGGKSPTMITPAVTEAGVIMGTAAYMSPEQARGKFVDQRTDIWAFGCLLFEMLTGQPAFIGEDVMIVMASILRDKSDLDSIPASISPAVRHAIELCLEKDPKKRLHHIGDVRLALAGVLESGVLPAGAAPRSSPLQFWFRAMPLAVIVAMLVGLATWQFKPEEARTLVRFVHEPPLGRALSLITPGVLDVAPDGRRLVYNSSDGLVVRDVDAIEDRVIPGTNERFGVEFSPDGESLAFARMDGLGAALVRMALTGGAEINLASWPSQELGGITWQTDGTLLVSLQGEGIFRVSENGGEPELLVELETHQRLDAPQLLPGGEWKLFSLTDGGGGREVIVQSLVTGERKSLRPGAKKGRFAPTGHLLYQVASTLFAVRFDPQRAELLGAPAPVVQDVGQADGINVAHYALADDGTLAYVPGSSANPRALTLALTDGYGNEQAQAMPAGHYANPRASADGRFIAYEAQFNNDSDIAVYEIGSTAAPRRLTFGSNNTRPVWSADGMRVAYSAARADGAGIYWRLGDGTGAEERLTQAAADETHTPDHFSPDGRYLAYTVARNGASAIWQLELASGNASLLIAAPGFGASHAVFSPDGRWLAYQGYDTGENEIFVQPFPPTGAKYQLPARGNNHHPTWSPDGSQLYYIPGPGRFERVDVSTERGIGFGSPATLTLDPLLGEGPANARTYDLMPDGSILGIISQGGETVDRNRIIVVQNWFEELNRLVPAE